MNNTHDLELLIASRVPLLSVETHDESLAVDLVAGLCRAKGWQVCMWKVTDGLKQLAPAPQTYAKTQRPEEVLNHIRGAASAAVYLLLDFHPYLADPVNVRLLRDIAEAYETTARTVILVSPSLDLPLELKKISGRFELAVADREAVMEILKEEVRRLQAEPDKATPLGEREAVESLIQHLIGMPRADARRIIRQSLRDDAALTLADLAGILKAKHDLVGQGGVLSYEVGLPALDDLAGLEQLKRWLLQRRAVFVGDQAGLGLPPPKGIMLLGVQGCGKSMAAKAVAAAWGVPLLRLDFGALFNKFLGETERNLREALKSADAMAPCVLWIDEIEKGVAQSHADGGESRRLLGTLLTWMAEHKSRVFLIATSNDIESLPPELVRKGRLDEIFFVDLPRADIRKAILRIHLLRRGQTPDQFDLDALMAATEGFSGAEIEQAVVAALYEASARGEILNTGHLTQELARTRPLSIVMAEKVAYLRLWARDRTVMAD
ncbi:MAG: AAA family ATPase [Sulfuritalea sp.]|nr:AAA family ATPase [Sulfuritalea sp.]MDP1985579.1 AAA family ATPase [Sulfuritalea sp.]